MSAIFGIDARVAPPRSGATTEKAEAEAAKARIQSRYSIAISKRRGLRRSGPPWPVHSVGVALLAEALKRGPSTS